VASSGLRGNNRRDIGDAQVRGMDQKETRMNILRATQDAAREVVFHHRYYSSAGVAILGLTSVASAIWGAIVVIKTHAMGA
jgi:hypothetical protein